MNIDQLNAVHNLIDLGFTARQADFLYIVGTHTGVFSMQHYRQFARVAPGNATDRLTRRLLALSFVTRFAVTDKDFVYHLDNKRFYRAILTEDSRLRRGMSPGLMRQRLQYMDYICQHPDERYLTTEQSKREIIAAQFGIADELMPRQMYYAKKGDQSTLRYFPERYPLFIKETDNDVALGIVYGEDPANSFRCFRKFVTGNRAFLDAVPSLHFVYVSLSAHRQRLAVQLLSDLFESSHAVSTSELRRYFALRQKLDNNQQRTFTDDDYAFWSYAHARYNRPKYEPLYAEFCGQISFSAVSCASPRKVFDCECFTPFTTLQDGVGGER